MNRLHGFTLLLFALSCSGLFAQQPFANNPQSRTVAPGGQNVGAALFRHTNLDDAWGATQASQRPLLLYATSDHCSYCTKMLRTTLSQEQIADGVSRFSEPVKFNGSDSPELAKQLGIRVYPTTLIIAPDSQLLHKIEGFVDAKEFADRIWPVLIEAEKIRRANLSVPQNLVR